MAQDDQAGAKDEYRHSIRAKGAKSAVIAGE